MEDIDITENLDVVFRSYAGPTELMDHNRFLKFFKDCHLCDKKFTVTDADLLFLRISQKTAKKIDFKQFKDALQYISDKKGLTLDELLRKIGKFCFCGPIYRGTQAAYNPLYDGKFIEDKDIKKHNERKAIEIKA